MHVLFHNYMFLAVQFMDLPLKSKYVIFKFTNTPLTFLLQKYPSIAFNFMFLNTPSNWKYSAHLPEIENG